VRYDEAGVDIARADHTLAGLRERIRSTFTPYVKSDIGHFAGLIEVPGAGPGAPLLAASTDGVGTKLLVARDTRREAEAAGDLVRHCVNDILVMGALPLFFLDYFAAGRLEPRVLEACVTGIAEACRAEGAALLGGETAEMPDLYAAGDFDLAGTIVGTVPRERVLDGRAIAPGDELWALASSGLHTNGFSLARRVVARAGLGWDDPLPGAGATVADALLAPHRSYLKVIEPLLDVGVVKGLAHITGGGITDNLPRILPEGVSARIRRDAWPVPPLFSFLQRAGQVPIDDMYRTFNMGVGMIVACAAGDVDRLRAMLSQSGEQNWTIGELVSGNRGVEYA
jgi:phosphoribosylformylglycinamidine cyclo-ligase